MVARDERHHLDFVRLEAAQVAVLDQVIGMPMVARIADVRAEVVHQRRILEPLALAIGQPVNGARLVEQRERQPRDVLRVHREVVAALGQLDGAAAPHVGNAIDLRDLSLVAPHVVEDEPFAEREIAQRQLVGAEPPKDRVEQDRAGDDEVGAPRIEAGHRQPTFEVASRRLPSARGASAWRRRAGSAAPPERRRGRLSRRRRRGSGSCPTCRSTRSKPIAVICSQ